MPKWKYLVIETYAKLNQRKAICLVIKKKVENRGLSDIIPFVKYEIGRTSEYFLGLIYDSNASAGGISAEDLARAVLEEAGVHYAHAFPDLEPNEVRKLLEGTIGCDSFTIPIDYETLEGQSIPLLEELLSELENGQTIQSERKPEETEAYARLLYWCSSVGSGDISRLNEVSQTLGLSTAWGGAWSILRRLNLLGHLEFSGRNPIRWAVIPPTALVPVKNPDQRILVGQRTPSILERIKRNNSVEDVEQHGAPSLIRFWPRDGAASNNGTCFFQESGCIAGEMARLLPSFGEWVSSLPSWDERDFSRYGIEEYDMVWDNFVERTGCFIEPKERLYRFKYQRKNAAFSTLAFFDKNSNRWICGDYYGLRFVARCRSCGCRSYFDVKGDQLIIPETDRWPMPYEKVLVLASGSLPKRKTSEDGTGYWVYSDITEDLASRLSNLLGLKMEGLSCTI